MTPCNLTSLTVLELLATHSAVLDELKRRNVIRSKNNPTGDYAESLVKDKLGLEELEKKSAKGYDAKDHSGKKYQIKARRVTHDNDSTQLGVIRNLNGNDFDFLIAVIFDEAWQVSYAAKIPHATVLKLVGLTRLHVIGHIMNLPRSIFKNPEVEDISHVLRS